MPQGSRFEDFDWRSILISGETFLEHSMLENLNKISLTSIEKAPVIQPNIYSLGIPSPIFL